MYRILYMSEIGNAKTLMNQNLYANSIAEALKFFMEDYGYSEKHVYSISKLD